MVERGTLSLERIVEHAKSEVEQLQLTVVASNERALQFYKNMDFETYGIERRALKIGGTYHDEAMLVRFLD